MNNNIAASNKDIIFYKKENGDTNIELLINGETLWVTQKTMAEIFDVQRPAITKHLNNIFQVWINFIKNIWKKINIEFRLKGVIVNENKK